jgi:hypothetical protein
MHNMYEAYYRVYAALNIRDIDGILLPQNNQMPKDPATENASVLNGMKLKAFAGQQHDAHMLAHLVMGLSPTVQSNPLAAMELQQHIYDHVRLKAEEDVAAELFMQYGADPDRMVSDIQREGLIALRIAVYIQELKQMQSSISGEGGEDPVVALKQQEIAMREKLGMGKLQLDQAKLQQTTAYNNARLQLQMQAQANKGVRPNAA